jgi:hypothetical protein
MKTATFTLPTRTPAKLYLGIAAIALALLAIPQIGHAQGIVRGAQQGAYEGNRGAGVGGAMGAVEGVLGIPYRGHYRCRGFYDRHSRFHCYR